AAGAHGQVDVGDRPLAVRDVILHGRLAFEPVLFDVADDADELAPDGVALRVPLEADPLAQGVLVRPELSRHRLVNDRDGLRALHVAVVEVPAFDERDAHRLEVARAREPAVTPRRHLPGRHLTAFDGKTAARIHPAHRQAGREADRLDAGQGRDAFESLLVKAVNLRRLLVFALR